MKILHLIKNVSYFLTLIVILSSCKHARKIPKPEGEMCINDYAVQTAYCEDIKLKSPLPDRPYSQTDAWLTMPVSTWNSVLEYIDKLIEKMNGNSASVNPEDLEKIKTEIKSMVDNLEVRRDSTYQ